MMTPKAIVSYWFRYNEMPSPPPTNTYVTEDGSEEYVTEDGTQPYVPET